MGNLHAGSRIVVLVMLAAWAVIGLLLIPQHWYMEDADAYWNAALRLRSGEPLYFSVAADPANPVIYRYAPWFAYAWIPLTYLPYPAVMVGWCAVLLTAAAWLLWPARWSWAAVALSLLVLPNLLRSVSTGNAQALLLAVCAVGMSSRFAPLLIGAAASLKGWPILFAVPLGLRTFALTALVFLLGASGAAAHDLSSYPAPVGMTPGSLAISLVIARWVTHEKVGMGFGRRHRRHGDVGATDRRRRLADDGGDRESRLTS